MNGGGLALGEVVTQDIRHKITQKLQDIFGDDDVSVLTDYICHMVNHNQTKEHITNELREFLSDEAVQFGDWVSQLVNSSNDNKRQSSAGSVRTVDNIEKSSDINGRVGIQNSENSSFGDSLIQGDTNNRRVTHSNGQSKDSLDIAISNAIKSGEANSTSVKVGLGRQKQSPFQTGVRSDLVRGQHYSIANSSNQDFSAGPLIPTGVNNRKAKVNYRNTPYMRTNIFPGSGAFPSPMPGTSIGSTSSITAHQTANKVKIRCKNWPNCDKGDNCFYIHPSEACKAWPLCSYGPGCFYIHPSVPCRFGLACYNSICNYNHPIGWDPYHNEVPVFKYGGYKNSSLIINNTNSNSSNSGSANNNTSESTDNNDIGSTSMNVETIGFSNNC